MYCNHLYFKKERDEIDRQLIEDIHLKLVELSYRKLDDEQKKPFKTVWED
jgi:hypothetical protein